jgi:hypothetical protein
MLKYAKDFGPTLLSRVRWALPHLPPHVAVPLRHFVDGGNTPDVRFAADDDAFELKRHHTWAGPVLFRRRSSTTLFDPPPSPGAVVDDADGPDALVLAEREESPPRGVRRVLDAAAVTKGDVGEGGGAAEVRQRWFDEGGGREVAKEAAQEKRRGSASEERRLCALL